MISLNSTFCDNFLPLHVNLDAELTESMGVDSTAQLLRVDLAEPTNEVCSDRGLKLMLREQLEGARSSAVAPMAFLSVQVAGRPLRLDLGMQREQEEAFTQLCKVAKPVGERETESYNRVSQRWQDKGIGSYLMAPVWVDNRLAGALYVVDGLPREFDELQVEAVVDIAYIVGKRLERFLGPEREERRESLMRRAVSPAFAELRNALVPLNLGTSDLRMVADDLKPLMHRISDSKDDDDTLAGRAYEDLLSLIDEISRASERVREVVMVVEGLWGEGGRNVVLRELLDTSAGLALHSTRLVGGVEIPDVPAEFSVRARRSVAVAGLSLLLSRAAEVDASNVTEVCPLTMKIDTHADYFVLRVSGKNMLQDECEQIAVEVEMLLLGDHDLTVSTKGTEIAMRLTRRS